MSSPEQNSQKLTGNELKLIIPSLIKPYEGAFEDVYADYIADPELFINALLYRMSVDNPGLTLIITLPALFTDNEDSSKWAAVYYEIFARSAEKVGVPPLFIPEEKVDIALKLGTARLMPGFDSETERIRVTAREKHEIELRRGKDVSLSPELAKFWGTVERHVEMMKEEGAQEYDIHSNFMGLYTMQEMLHRQQDEYSLIAQDVNGLI